MLTVKLPESDDDAIFDLELFIIRKFWRGTTYPIRCCVRFVVTILRIR